MTSAFDLFCVTSLITIICFCVCWFVLSTSCDEKVGKLDFQIFEQKQEITNLKNQIKEIETI